MILHSCSIDNQRNSIHWNRSHIDTHHLIRPPLQLDDSSFMQYKTIKGSLYIGIGLILIHILYSNLIYNWMILHSCNIDDQRKSIHWNRSDIDTQPLIQSPLQLTDSASCSIRQSKEVYTLEWVWYWYTYSNPTSFTIGWFCIDAV